MRCGRLKVSNIFVIDEISNEDTRFLKVEIDGVKETPKIGYGNTCKYKHI